VLPFDCIPGSHVFVGFSVANCAQAAPKEEPANWKGVDWWNPEIVIEEETIQKLEIQKNHRIANDSPSLVTVPNFPISPTFFSFHPNKIIIH